MKKVLFIIVILFIPPSQRIYSQGIKLPTDIKTPNASNLGKYGDTPVSYYSGTTNIDVPILSLNDDNNLPINISLNYDSSGIKINSVPSWVGQNWSLNAGGVIARTQRGSQIDEKLKTWTGPNGHTYSEKGYLYAKERIAEENWADTEHLNNLVYESLRDPDEGSNLYSRMDLEPDIFNFNFLGITGKFFLGQDGIYKVQSNQNLKVSILESDFSAPPNFVQSGSGFDTSFSGKSIGKITIEDDRGNKYIFGKDSSSIEYSVNNFFAQSSVRGVDTPLVANAWYLSEIINNHGHVIYNFTYERGSPLANIYKRNHYKKGSCYYGYPTGWATSTDNATFDYKYHGGTLNFPVYLTEINSQSGNKIVFSSSDSGKTVYPSVEYGEYIYATFEYRFYYLINGDYDPDASTPEKYEFLFNQLKWRKLDSVVLYDYNDTLISEYEFNYNIESLNTRLNLHSIDRVGKDNTFLNNYYEFEYENFDELPGCLSRKFDHWGYFNGNDYVVRHRSSLFDFDGPEPGYFDSHEPSRASSSNFTTYGLLKRINYPTKGYTQFSYEAHRANFLVNDLKQIENYTTSSPIGGVRIKEIVDFDGISEIKKKNYTYNDGYLFYKPKYEQPYWPSQIGSTFFYFDINNTISLSNINGSHIGYSMVTESFDDGSYNVYKYSNFDDYPDEPYEATLSLGHSIFDKGNDRSFQRGKLYELNKYNSNDEKVQETYYSYRNTNESNFRNSYVRAFEYSFNDCSFGEHYGNAYKLFYFDFDIIREIKTDFLENGYIRTITDYEKSDYSISTNENIFNGTRFTNSISSMNSEGDLIEANNYYPFDLEINTFPHMETLISQNRISELIKKEVRKNGILVSSNIINYDFFGNSTGGIILPKSLSKSKGIGVLEEGATIDLRDSKGNITQYHTKDNVFYSMIWGYNQTQLIAKIKNTAFPNISNVITNLKNLSNLDNDRTIGNIGNEGNLREGLNNLKNEPTLSNTQITTYTYDPLIGVTSVTEPTGNTVYYDYDEFNRLKYVKDKDGNILSANDYNFKN